MKLLAIDHVRIATVVEMLAPWPGGSPSYRQTNHNGKLLHRTYLGGELPDPRYWTAYDHFMTEYEVRAQRAAYFSGLLRGGWRKLTAVLARLTRRAAPSVRRAS